MTIKHLAHRTQQRLSDVTAGSLKRSHVYELLAATFGYDSYAAFRSESVFAELEPSAPLPVPDTVALKGRCGELGFAASAEAIATRLIDELQAARQTAVQIEAVVEALQTRPEGYWGWEIDDDTSAADGSALSPLHHVIDFEADALPAALLESLESSAERSNAKAHYALALYFRGGDGDHSRPQGSEYWYQQRQAGEQLSPAATEWADQHGQQLDHARRADFHLREAARLGDRHALLDLADFHGDPTFFDALPDEPIDEDPARIAEIAARLGRDTDAYHWLTIAAQAGDVESMEALIESYDKDDLPRCWTWVYFAQRLGTDLTKPDMRAYHDGGPQADQEYDDDYGGAAYVAGREAIQLEPLGGEADRIARQRAEELYREFQEQEGDAAEDAKSG